MKFKEKFLVKAKKKKVKLSDVGIRDTRLMLRNAKNCCAVMQNVEIRD